MVDKTAVEMIIAHPRTKILFPVYTALCFHANGKRRCFPAYERLMEITGITGRATISTAVKCLEEMGILTRTTGRGRSTRYTLLEEASRSSLGERLTPTGSSLAERSSSAAERGSSLSERGSSVSEREEEVKKRNQKEDTHKRKEGEGVGKEDIYSFITSMRGCVAPIEKRFVEKMLITREAQEVFSLVEECYLNDPILFKKRGILPLREVAEPC